MARSRRVGICHPHAVGLLVPLVVDGDAVVEGVLTGVPTLDRRGVFVVIVVVGVVGVERKNRVDAKLREGVL